MILFEKYKKRTMYPINPYVYGYVPVLNIQPHSAYSLRKVVPSYNGYAIQVRRTSDNALLNVGFVNNELDKQSIVTFVGTGSGLVEVWYDQAGLSRNLIRANTPYIVISGVFQTKNGKPSVYYNGISRHILASSASANGLCTIATWASDVSRPNGRVFDISGASDAITTESPGFHRGVSKLYSIPSSLNSTISSRSTVAKFGAYTSIGVDLLNSGLPNYYAYGFSNINNYSLIGFVSELIIYNQYYTDEQLAFDLNFAKKYYSII